MRSKYTAIKDVRIYANVVTQMKQVREGVVFPARPVNTKQWVEMRAGETREDISLILGIDPKLLPDEKTELVGTNMWVVRAERPTFHGFLKIED